MKKFYEYLEYVLLGMLVSMGAFIAIGLVLAIIRLII